MEILKGIETSGLGVFLREDKTLIISDVHVGLEESLNKQGVLVPRFQLKRLLEELEKTLRATRPERVVIAGDLKHEFGTISEQEWRDALKVLDFLGRSCKEIVLVRGNHDKILGPIAGKRDIMVVDHMKLGDVYITHGDKIPEDEDLKKSKVLIIGHEHPAVAIREKSRVELFKCFLVGKWKGKSLIVVPSMNFVAEGTDVLSEKLLSPFLEDIGDFRVIVVAEGAVGAEEALDFGKVRGLLSSGAR